MSFLSSIAPVTELLRLASGILQPAAVRSPGGFRAGPNPAEGFSTLLRTTLDTAEKSARNTILAKDMNGDGKLTRGELGVGREVFERLDANGDGFVDRGELVKAYALRNADGGGSP